MIDLTFYALADECLHEVCELLIVRKIGYEKRYNIGVFPYFVWVRGCTGKITFENRKVSLAYFNLTQEVLTCSREEVADAFVRIREIFELAVCNPNRVVCDAP